VSCGKSITSIAVGMLMAERPERFPEGLDQEAFTTPGQYIIRQRLRRAQHQLASTRRDITSIALDCGFSSHSHLSASFARHLGCTPREHRGSSWACAI